MPVEIRLLQPGDADVLTRAAPRAFDHPIDDAASRAFLDDPHHHLAVAIDRDVVVGFVSAVHYLLPDRPDPELWINEVQVAPSHYRRGLGKAMLAAMLEHARALGCPEAWVLTDTGNVPAMRLYGSLGGEEGPPEDVMFTFRLGGGA